MPGQSIYGDQYTQQPSAQMPGFMQQPTAQLPTTAQQPGYMQGPFANPSELAPITSSTQPPALTLENIQFLNAALKSQIGKKMTVQFLIGTNTFVDKTGTLLAVGANYIVLMVTETNDILFCDFFSIKFINVYH